MQILKKGTPDGAPLISNTVHHNYQWGGGGGGVALHHPIPDVWAQIGGKIGLFRARKEVNGVLLYGYIQEVCFQKVYIQSIYICVFRWLTPLQVPNDRVM